MSTPLHVAAREGKLELVVELLEAGTDVNGLEESQDDGDGDGDPFPLHEAVIGGHVDTVAYLLYAGAMVDPRANVQRLLREKGIDLDADHGTQCPLHTAIYLCNIDVVRVLVGAGADVSARVLEYPWDYNFKMPLHIAAEKDNPMILTVLLDVGADVDAQDGYGFTALHHAKSVSTVDTLLAAGANPNIVSTGGEIVLRYTPIGGFCTGFTRNNELGEVVIEIVDALLRHGVDTSIPVDSEGCAGTLVGCAVQVRNSGLVSRLLDAGLDPNERQAGGMLPIHYAATSDQVNVLRLLLQRGADRESCTLKYGSTPLHIACRRGSLECVQELLRWKVSLTKRENGPSGSGDLPEDVVGANDQGGGCGVCVTEERN